MILVDVDVLHKEMQREIRDMVTDEDRECMRYADSVIDRIPEIKAIPIEWLRKELIECLYDGVSSEDVNKVFFKTIAKWEKQNEQV